MEAKKVTYLVCHRCVKIPDSPECVACQINQILVDEIKRTPTFDCFHYRRIYFEIDEKHNSKIVGYYGDPCRLIAALVQTDAYHLAHELLFAFDICIESFQYNDAFPIVCEIKPKISFEGGEVNDRAKV